ncbi:MAG: hypothetical protein AMS17_12975, partial [Spirochaetes bacterium DG_61]
NIDVKNPFYAMKAGISLIPENRNEEGVFLILAVLENLAAATVDKRRTMGLIQKHAENAVINDIIDKLSIKVTSTTQIAQSLSGGNLQKLVLGKWLISEPKVIIMLELLLQSSRSINLSGILQNIMLLLLCIPVTC